jgi:hypothetical protein
MLQFPPVERMVNCVEFLFTTSYRTCKFYSDENECHKTNEMCFSYSHCLVKQPVVVDYLDGIIHDTGQVYGSSQVHRVPHRSLRRI